MRPRPLLSTLAGITLAAALLSAACVDRGYSDAAAANNGSTETSGVGSSSAGGAPTAPETSGGASSTTRTTGTTSATTAPEVEPPCLEVLGVESGQDDVTAPFGLGTIPLGEQTSRALELLNCSTEEDLAIASAQLAEGSDAAFTLTEGLRDNPTVLAPGDALGLEVTFAPTEAGLHDGLLEIVAGAADSPEAERRGRVVPLTGFGGGSCEEVATEARAREEGAGGSWVTALEVGPLATIQFDAQLDPGTDPNALPRFEWTLVAQPEGSHATFAPNSAVRAPQMFVTTVGRYEVELLTLNARGVPACETTRITITVTPQEDIHIQLHWDTPGDDDQTDTGVGVGSDVDLHFLHPRGSWNASPWDCYWLNIAPDWGRPGNRADDPGLNRDDTDGSGPEVLGLDSPEEVTYRVGVYYFSDHGFGPSFPVVQIYLGGELVFEAGDRELVGTGWFWEVADIRWPDREVARVNALREGFP